MLRASSWQPLEIFRHVETLLSVQPALMFDSLSSEERVFPLHTWVWVLLQYVVVVFCPPAVHHCGEPGSSLINLPMGICPPTAVFSRLDRALLWLLQQPSTRLFPSYWCLPCIFKAKIVCDILVGSNEIWVEEDDFPQSTVCAPLDTTQNTVGLPCCQRYHWLMFNLVSINIHRSFFHRVLPQPVHWKGFLLARYWTFFLSSV